ncbi:MAG: hypothetical protein IT373_01825 [Polyangiaceae bacterium]|nr:hypothetical protein [Polyangiaceae bacterium]
MSSLAPRFAVALVAQGALACPAQPVHAPEEAPSVPVSAVTPTAPGAPELPVPPPDEPRSDGPCGRLASDPVIPARWPYGPPGGNPTCDRAATAWANVLHDDRACRTDADCVAVSGDGGCWSAALNRSAVGKPEYQDRPCGNPASGACGGPEPTATCSGGCCSVGQSGP